jgi:hypothetical protein
MNTPKNTASKSNNAIDVGLRSCLFNTPAVWLIGNETEGWKYSGSSLGRQGNGNSERQPNDRKETRDKLARYVLSRQESRRRLKRSRYPDWVPLRSPADP